MRIGAAEKAAFESLAALNFANALQSVDAALSNDMEAYNYMLMAYDIIASDTGPNKWTS